MNSIILPKSLKKKYLFLGLSILLLFYLFRYFYNDQYPDWVSYKLIYSDNDNVLVMTGLDYLYIFLMNICNMFGLDYDLFRLLILFLISFFFAKGIINYGTNQIIFFTILNSVFIFFQIREGLAVAILYYAFSLKNKKHILLLNIASLFCHFTSIIFVILAKQSKKIIKIVLFSILVSVFLMYNLFYEMIYDYIAMRYSHNILDLDVRDIVYSDYFFVTPLLYLLLVLNVKVRLNDVLKNIFFIFLLFCTVYPFFFSFLSIPNVVFNSLYRFVVIYLSFMLLKNNFKPNLATYIVLLFIVAKDLLSSQILYE